MKLVVRGRVQGVGFRWATQEEAQRLGLTGWVRNLADGAVEVVAEGSRPDLEALAGWCRAGPRFAQVRGVDILWEEALGEFVDFSIERTA